MLHDEFFMKRMTGLKRQVEKRAPRGAHSSVDSPSLLQRPGQIRSPAVSLSRVGHVAFVGRRVRFHAGGEGIQRFWTPPGRDPFQLECSLIDLPATARTVIHLLSKSAILGRLFRHLLQV